MSLTASRLFRNRSIKVPTAVRIRDRSVVIFKASEVIVRQLLSLLLTIDEVVHSTHTVRPSVVARSTSDAAQRQYTVVETHPYEFVGSTFWVVAVLRGVVLNPGVLDRFRIRGIAADHFGDESSAEGGDVAHSELSIRVRWVGLQIEWFAEVVDAH